MARSGFSPAAGCLLVQAVRLPDLAPARRMIGVRDVSMDEQIEMLALAFLLARGLQPRDRHRHETLGPRAKHLGVRPRRRLGGDRVPAAVDRVGVDVRPDQPRLAAALVDEEIPDALLQILAEASFFRIGESEQAAGEDDGLEKALGQIVRVAWTSRDRCDEGADRCVVPLSKLVERRGRIVAVARRFRE